MPECTTGTPILHVEASFILVERGLRRGISSWTSLKYYIHFSFILKLIIFIYKQLKRPVAFSVVHKPVAVAAAGQISRLSSPNSRQKSLCLDRSVGYQAPTEELLTSKHPKCFRASNKWFLFQLHEHKSFVDGHILKNIWVKNGVHVIKTKFNLEQMCWIQIRMHHISLVLIVASSQQNEDMVKEQI